MVKPVNQSAALIGLTGLTRLIGFYERRFTSWVCRFSYFVSPKSWQSRSCERGKINPVISYVPRQHNNVWGNWSVGTPLPGSFMVISTWPCYLCADHV